MDNKKILCSFFMIIIFIPMVSQIFKLDFGVQLSGAVADNVIPKLNIDKVMAGDFQNEADEYLRNSMPIRNIVIKSGNQLVYKIFKKSTNDSIAIGKHQQLFEKMYIYKELQFYPPATQEQLYEQMEHLEILQDKLNEKGINVLLFITPYKTEFYKDDIPWIYRVCAGELSDENNNYEQFIKMLKDSDIKYFDSVEYVEKLRNEYQEKVFPKTGTHWTQVTGMRVAKELLNVMEEKFEYDMGDVEIEVKKTDKAAWPDDDLFQILNLISKPTDEYHVGTIKINQEGKDKPDILCRGCSFMGQSIYYLIENNLVGENIYMENTFARINNEETIEVSDYDTIDLKSYVKGKDLIIFEANQASIDNIGLGLMEYMYQNFDSIFE